MSRPNNPVKTTCLAISWDEIGGDTNVIPDLVLTRGQDMTLVDEVRRQLYEDEDDTDREWELVAVVHTPRVTLIEFRSSRGHVATTQIVWAA